MSRRPQRHRNQAKPATIEKFFDLLLLHVLEKNPVGTRNSIISDFIHTLDTTYKQYGINYWERTWTNYSSPKRQQGIKRKKPFVNKIAKINEHISSISVRTQIPPNSTGFCFTPVNLLHFNSDSRSTNFSQTTPASTSANFPQTTPTSSISVNFPEFTITPNESKYSFLNGNLSFTPSAHSIMIPSVDYNQILVKVNDIQVELYPQTDQHTIEFTAPKASSLFSLRLLQENNQVESTVKIYLKQIEEPFGIAKLYYCQQNVFIAETDSSNDRSSDNPDKDSDEDSEEHKNQKILNEIWANNMSFNNALPSIDNSYDSMFYSEIERLSPTDSNTSSGYEADIADDTDTLYTPCHFGRSIAGKSVSEIINRNKWNKPDSGINIKNSSNNYSNTTKVRWSCDHHRGRRNRCIQIHHSNLVVDYERDGNYQGVELANKSQFFKKLAFSLSMFSLILVLWLTVTAGFNSSVDWANTFSDWSSYVHNVPCITCSDVPGFNSSSDWLSYAHNDPLIAASRPQWARQKILVLTFDDGLASNVTNMSSDILDNLPAIFFQTFDHLDPTSPDDLSPVYGSDETTARLLRALDGTGKLLRQIGTDGREYLPYNTMGVGQNNRTMFAGGNSRTNQDCLLLAIHTLFLREHNRLCDFIKVKYQGWNEEKIYQAVRHINILKYLILLNQYAGFYFTPELVKISPPADLLGIFRIDHNTIFFGMNSFHKYPGKCSFEPAYQPPDQIDGQIFLASQEMSLDYRFHEFFISQKPLVNERSTTFNYVNVIQMDSKDLVNVKLDDIFPRVSADNNDIILFLDIDDRNRIALSQCLDHVKSLSNKFTTVEVIQKVYAKFAVEDQTLLQVQMQQKELFEAGLHYIHYNSSNSKYVTHLQVSVFLLIGVDSSDIIQETIQTSTPSDFDTDTSHLSEDANLAIYLAVRIAAIATTLTVFVGVTLNARHRSRNTAGMLSFK